MNTHETDRAALLRQLQAEDFAIYEVTLYLDGHPHCQKALKYYHEHKRIAEALKAEFEQRFEPLTIYGNRNEIGWDWVNSPWPWEKEGN